MPRLIQPSFAKGELSPALYGRVDTAAYQVGLRKARNVIVHPYGGISSRDGLEFLEPVKDHTKDVRLIPFEFKTTDQYVLEFGDQYMRVMRNNAHVLDASEQEAITNITQANPAVVTTAAHGYSNGDEVFIQNVVGMTEVNNLRFTIANVTATTFELTDQVDGTNVDSTAFTAYTSGGTADIIFELTTPYLEAELFDLTFTQSADVMTICHINHNIRELNRLANDNWTLTTPTFAPSIADPTNVAITVNTAGAVTDRYRVTAINSDDEESLSGVSNDSDTITGATQANPVVITAVAHSFIIGDEVEITGIVGMTELNGRRFQVGTTTANTFELAGEDGTGHTAYISDGTARGTFDQVTNSSATQDNTITWNAVTGAVKYAVYRRENGVYGFIGESTSTTFEDDNINPDTSIGPPETRNPFELDNNPRAVTFYEQRRVFGGTTNEPDTSFFSQTGRINNFTIRTPLQDDDAITAQLTSRQVNEIRQYVPTTDLVTFTSGAEWTLTAGADAALTPSTLQQRPQTRWGSSFLPPIEIGRTIMFIPNEKNRVRSHGFSLQLDGYTGTDMMIFAEHLLENDTIRDWTYTRSPETRIHVVLTSGSGLTFTFDQEQEVIAWTTWDTTGDFESCMALRGNGTDNEDSVYYVVNRTINSRSVKYIEVWKQRFFEDVEDCFFVDSGLTLDTPLTITGSTAANPVVITSTAHGLSNDDEVDIEDIVWVSSFDATFNETQPAQLNGGRFIVKNVTANTFELQDEDGNVDGSAFAAYVSGGVARKAVTTLSGLNHLEGEAVVALTDGNVETSLTVASGAVTLPRPTSRVHIGLRYIADLETLDIESPRGTTQGQDKKVTNVIVRFRRSRGLLIGPNTGDLTEMKQREFELLGEPTRLLTGDKEIDILPDWNTNGRIFLRQKDPLPMTILAVIPHLELGDED